MAIKFLSLIVALYLFVVVVEALDQNFYAARYGKREESDSNREKNVMDERFGRSADHADQDSLIDRKIRFFLSSGRYGKRGCTTENCSQGSKEIVGSGFQNVQDRGDKIRIPIRKSNFLVGSRFGKRKGSVWVYDGENGYRSKDLRCIFTGVSDFYQCSNVVESRDPSELFDSYLNNDSFKETSNEF